MFMTKTQSQKEHNNADGTLYCSADGTSISTYL